MEICSDDGSRTPAHWAAVTGMQGVLELLISAAADRQAKVAAALQANADAADASEAPLDLAPVHVCWTQVCSLWVADSTGTECLCGRPKRPL